MNNISSFELAKFYANDAPPQVMATGGPVNSVNIPTRKILIIGGVVVLVFALAIYLDYQSKMEQMKKRSDFNSD